MCEGTSSGGRCAIRSMGARFAIAMRFNRVRLTSASSPSLVFSVVNLIPSPSSKRRTSSSIARAPVSSACSMTSAVSLAEPCATGPGAFVTSPSTVPSTASLALLNSASRRACSRLALYSTPDHSFSATNNSFGARRRAAISIFSSGEHNSARPLTSSRNVDLSSLAKLR